MYVCVSFTRKCVLLQLFCWCSSFRWKLIFLCRARLALSTAIQSDPKSACICCHTATNGLSLTEGTEVILCCRITDRGHFVSERINGKMSQWAQRMAMWCHESNWCSFVNNHDRDDDQNCDVTPSSGSNAQSHNFFAQLHGSMWSQRVGTDGEITVCWFHAVLHEVNHVNDSVHILYTDFLPCLFCASVHICVCISWSEPGRGPLQRSQTCSQA